MINSIESAIATLKRGGVGIFPTDTAFAIGCRIDSDASVKRLFELRKRPRNQPAPALVAGIEMAKFYLHPLTSEVESLMQKYWPGGLTIVYGCKVKRVPELVRGGGSTLGVRMPNHEIAITLIKSVDVPILGSSANFHGKPTPYAFEDLDLELMQRVDFVLAGTCATKIASTVIDCSASPPKVIRKGVVKF